MKVYYAASDDSLFETASECAKYERIKGESKMKIKLIRKSQWKYASTKSGSNKFECERCGQVIYVKPTVGYKDAVCDYKYCPNCLSEMK